MTNGNAIEVAGLAHRYGPRVALEGVEFEVAAGEVFAFLGPNGGGKTTLFRLLSTLMPVQAGRVRVLGHDLASELFEVRRQIGVVFQAPSLDKKLTIDENISQQAALYGIGGEVLRQRREEVLSQLGLADRRSDRVELLSGGLKRRADLAKSLIHHPRLLLLDEPSTGLDPGARGDLWQYLYRLREEKGLTIVLTSHLLDEADRANRIAIIDRGHLVASGPPGDLRSSIGGHCVTIETDSPAAVVEGLKAKLGVTATVVNGEVVVEGTRDASWLPRILELFPTQVQSVKLGRPTLADVFLQKTGHRFWQESVSPTGVKRA